MFSNIQKCGKCLHCTRPNMRKACLNPVVRADGGDGPAEFGAQPSKLSSVINYVLKAERDLGPLLVGPWAGPDAAERRSAWQAGLREASTVPDVARHLLTLEAAVRRVARAPA